MSQFVHLHNHTHYSILDAIITVPDLVKAAKEDNQSAIALTDHGVMFGAIEFYKECKKQKIKPIIGCEVYIANGSRLEQTAGQQKTKKKNYFHLLLLAKNATGYQNLVKLSSLAHTEGFYYRPRIDKELLEKYSEGLICTTACMGGIVPALILENQPDEAKQEALYYKKIFGEDFYIELQRHHYLTDDYLIKKLKKLAHEINVKLIATNDIHYLRKADAVAHNAYLFIKDAKGKTEINIEELRYQTDEFYFRTQAEMLELFEDCPEAIANTLGIADKCNLELELGKLQMPAFPIPTGMSSNEYLKQLVYEGLKEKYTEITPEITKRTEYELSVISDMKFPGYFLIVWDFIRAAGQLGVGVGPGRGSAAGSIVAYALSITNVDPLRYELLFERFLNPERVSMPDIDIDFNDETRYKVIEYVKNKYGESSVAQIATFGTLATKAVITDVGRVLGLPLDKVKKITKEIGFKDKIKDGIKKASLAWTFEEPSEKYQQLWELCGILEGLNRNIGTHAAGVVIAPSDIMDYVPLYKSDKTSDTGGIAAVTQYEMKWLEEAGLVKMDFLGLRTLSIIEHTLEMIKNNYGIDIDLDKIDFDDADTYKMLSNGQTRAIFQFESSGMQEYLKQLKPQSLEELTAMNALYRPGPMGNIPNFIARKHGTEPITYLHPLMEKSLEKTYGVIVYQEQVMQLVQDLAGFSLGMADVLRRAMGKKKADEMARLQGDFVEGCAKNGISSKLATEIYNLIFAFASYGFNKSHALAYSYLAFQTAWLKTHYMAEFLAANMTAAMHQQNGLTPLIEEANLFGIKVLPPDVNTSTTNFIAKDGSIYFGMAGVKGVGTAAVDNIVKTREGQRFTSVFDFAARVELCNKRILEALICAGAFDFIHDVSLRSQLFESVDVIMEYSKKFNSLTDSNTVDLFASDAGANVLAEPQLKIYTPEWDTMERIAKEKEYLNFYVSGHPLDKYYTVIKSFNSVKLTAANPASAGDNSAAADAGAAPVQDVEEEVTANVYGYVSGMITGIRKWEDKNGNTMAFVALQNYDGTADLTFLSNTYEKYQQTLEVGNIVCCLGWIVKDMGETAKVTVEEMVTIEDAIEKYTEAILLMFDVNNYAQTKLEAVRDYIKEKGTDSGPVGHVQMEVYDDYTQYKQRYDAKDARIPYTSHTINELVAILDKDSVLLLPKEQKAARRKRRQ